MTVGSKTRSRAKSLASIYISHRGEVTAPNGPLVFPIGGIVAVLVMLCITGSIWIAHLNNTRVQYFPETLLENGWPEGNPIAGKDGKAVVQEYEQDWYSSIWRDLDEPSLYLQSQKPPGAVLKSIRFTWLPSFHLPVVIRIEWLASGAVRLTAKRANRMGWITYIEGQRHLVRNLTAAEQDALTRMLVSTLAFDGPDEGLLAGPDGANWIFEAASPKLYHYEAEWAPDGARQDAGLSCSG